jgi:hypothetical protein
MEVGQAFDWYVKAAVVNRTCGGTKERYLPKHAFDCGTIKYVENKNKSLVEKIKNLKDMQAMIQGFNIDEDKKSGGIAQLDKDIAELEKSIDNNNNIIKQLKA